MSAAINPVTPSEPVEYRDIADEGARFLIRAAFHWMHMLDMDSFSDDDAVRWFHLRDEYGLGARDAALVDAVVVRTLEQQSPRRRWWR